MKKYIELSLQVTTLIATGLGCKQPGFNILGMNIKCLGHLSIFPVNHVIIFEIHVMDKMPIQLRFGPSAAGHFQRKLFKDETVKG